MFEGSYNQCPSDLFVCICDKWEMKTNEWKVLNLLFNVLSYLGLCSSYMSPTVNGIRGYIVHITRESIMSCILRLVQRDYSGIRRYGLSSVKNSGG
jgi:hypothetical protein